jgi:hypothetical protein
MAYIGVSPSNGVRRRFVYEATASQTSFSGSDENGVTLTYVDSLYLDVYQNGIKLKAGDDYTATTGTSVVLVQGASANDVVEMVAFDVFSVGDTVSAKDGGNFAGNVAMAGTLGVTGVLTANGGAVFNEASADVDFRVESNGDANMLFVDGGNDRVGIGTSSPSVTLHVKSANPVFGLETTGTVSAGGTVYSELKDSTGTVFTSGFAGLANCYQFSTSAAAGFMRFLTGAGAEAVRIHSNQVLSASAGVALGVGTANTASNVLDDYEEGVWEPSIGGDATYTSQDGVFTKIGNMVHLQCKFQVNVIGTGSTNVLSGLPFASNNSWTSGSLSVEYYASIATSMVWVSGYVANNASTISFSGNSASATTIGHNGFAIFGNSARVDFQCSYRTA